MKKQTALLITGFILASSPAYAGEAAEERAIMAATVDEVSEIVEQDVEDTVGSLTAEYESMKAILVDFNAYQANPAMTEEFCSKTVSEMDALTIRLREYALRYAEIIMADTTGFDDKYDDLEDIYDDIYEDAAEEIYDTIYDDMLNDMYDDIYDGIIDDAYDFVAYDTWDDARSAEYSRWDDARTEVYTLYDDLRSDLYNFLISCVPTPTEQMPRRLTRIFPGSGKEQISSKVWRLNPVQR